MALKPFDHPLHPHLSEGLASSLAIVLAIVLLVGAAAVLSYIAPWG